MPCLTVIDVTGIQKYIFGTNRLKEIIGGSEIIAQATSWWIFDILRKDLKWITNIKDLAEKKPPFEAIDKSKTIETLDAEVIYAGGGNTLILFVNKDKAKEFTEKYTYKLLRDAKGLEVVVAHSKEFQMSDVSSDGKPKMLEIIDDTFKELNFKKANRQVSTPLLGLAVTAQCVSTGGVASEFDSDRKTYISTESYQKQQYVDDANQRLKNEGLQQLDFNRLEIPLDFDELGRTKGDTSFIAVVHTDGNGMGNRVEKIREKVKDGEVLTNQKVVENLRDFSESIYTSNLRAMEATINHLLDLIEFNYEKNRFIFTTKSILPIQKEFNLIQNKDKTKNYFPFRPLIFGGDDLSFVCDGRIALGLTAFYLKELQKHNLTDDRPIFGRAGVSIVKTHYPFSRAYKLAEELANGTKALIKEIDEDTKEVITLDWHVAMSGLLGDLDEIRKREYTIKINESGTILEKPLNMRPVFLHPQDVFGKWQTWEFFSQLINEFQGDNWNDKRNKLKELREVLRKGANETESFLKLRRLELPFKAQKDGWDTDGCVHFDAIEMLDLYYPI